MLSELWRKDERSTEMNDVFLAVIFVTLWIGAAIAISAVHIGGRIDELRHEIWELRMDLKERGKNNDEVDC